MFLLFICVICVNLRPIYIGVTTMRKIYNPFGDSDEEWGRTHSP
jgi:hypothetical protein